MSDFDKELDQGDQGEEIHEPELPFTDEPGFDEPGQRDIVKVRGPAASVAKARAFKTYLPVGYCCNFVWNCIAAPHRFGLADANAAWARAKQRRGGTNAPAGAPVYWAGGKHGHIALSVGGGKVRSTDWPAKGKVGEVGIEQMTKAWKLSYRGWSSDFAGAPIPGLGGAPQPFVAGSAIDDEAIRPGKRNESVRRFNKALWESMPADYRTKHQKAWMSEASDLYGPVSQQVCYDRYVLLNKKDPKKWPLPTKPVWPGPGLLGFLGLRAD